MCWVWPLGWYPPGRHKTSPWRPHSSVTAKVPCPPAAEVRGGQCVPGSLVAAPRSRGRQGGKQVFPSLKDRVHSTCGSQASSRHFCGLLTSFPGSRAAFWRLKLASFIAFTSSSHPVGLPLLTFPLSERGLACVGSTGWEIRGGA